MFLFFPFILLFLWRFQEWFSCRKLRDFLWISAKYTFLFSISIEMLQLFLRLGTWQVSDLFFNTLGGTIGGLVYWAGYKIKEKKSAQENLKYADQNL
jgi:glycopeptide antibiotics resistance protein